MTIQDQMLNVKFQSRTSKVKVLNFALLILVVLLSGCFGYFKKSEPKPAAPEPQAEVTPAPTPAQNGQAEIPEPPSFQDGDYYLQALTAKSLELCGKIRNSRLKERCETKVKEN